MACSAIYSALVLMLAIDTVNAAADSATAWGAPTLGGDLTVVDSGREAVDLSANVVDISCNTACVARFENGSATAWGEQASGGDLTVDLSAGVVNISCGGSACVALFENGSATAWGQSTRGGDAAADLSANVVDISCGDRACVARFENGSATAWGSADGGGDSSAFANHSHIVWQGDNRVTVKYSRKATDLTAGVVDISCGGHACVALFENGSAAAWGNSGAGGDHTITDNGNLGVGDRVVDLSANVVDISCGGHACVARFENGSATAWGNPLYGGDLTKTDYCSKKTASFCSTMPNRRVVDLSVNVVDISCGGEACVALFENGSATAWGGDGGDLHVGGYESNSPEFDTFVDLSANVSEISCGGHACVALFKNGSAAVWGKYWAGGDITKTEMQVDENGENTTMRVVDLSANVVDISCGGSACTAIFEDGSATVWGDKGSGGSLAVTESIDAESTAKRIVDLSANVGDISCGVRACVARFTPPLSIADPESESESESETPPGAAGGECDIKLLERYSEPSFKVETKAKAKTLIVAVKKAFKAIKESYRSAKSNLRKLGREAKE